MENTKDNIFAFIVGDLFVFSESLLTGAVEFGALSLKTLFIAILGGIGGMLGKWIWNQLIND